MKGNKINTGGAISFEETAVFDDGGKRIADVVYNDPVNGILYYEFKSVKNLGDNFIDQFTKDLQRPEVANLNQLKWVFDGSKIDAATLRSQVLSKLNANKAAFNSLLEAQKLQAFYPTSIIASIDDFINEFITKDYNNVFRVR